MEESQGIRQLSEQLFDRANTETKRRHGIVTEIRNTKK